MHKIRRFSLAVAVGIVPIATLPAAAQVDAPRAVQPAHPAGVHSAAVVDPAASTFW